MSPSYEKLGLFYLGREVDPATRELKPEPLLYDSRDLTTHAVCVGMTGSGKTGLCLSLLEEAAIDGVPAIAIDPKGDLSNLLLTFPNLAPEDFRPWVDAGEAARNGRSVDEHAAAIAARWKEGLAEWDQDGARIQRLRDAVEMSVYTPGSDAGRALSMLRSFAAPPAALLRDAAGLRERIGATVSGLLGLIGVDADPLASREYILLASLFENAWSAGRDLDIPALIQAVHKPPFEQVGVLDLETFFPAKERAALATALNNLLASPGFAAWRRGEPLEIDRLLFTERGAPRISIVSIAHLDDAQRMFVVTLLLGEVVAWMRRQTGSSSLRALVYMDEIFGFCPPSANPPSKLPLLTLMKQARAFGVGVVVATQNPVDLDYKGLSNAGTWFIGRLQTERDKARLMDGLQTAAGGGLDRAALEALLANPDARVFLMRNVHEEAPVVFKTRWALSYLRGPLTLEEISRLGSSARGPETEEPAPSQPSPNEAAAASDEPPAARKPVIPAGVDEYYLRTENPSPVYEARVLGVARLHFVDKSANVDVWETRSWIAPLDDAEGGPAWDQAEIHGDPAALLSAQAPAQATYVAPPPVMLRATSYPAWAKNLASHIYVSAGMPVFRCKQASFAAAADTEGEFRAALALRLREARDAACDKLRERYAARLRTLEDQARRAEERIERERSQLSDRRMQTAISVGTSILGALLGRKKISVSNAGRLGSAARNAGRVGRESEDVARAEENLERVRRRISDLETELANEIAALDRTFDPQTVPVERVELRPAKAQIDVTKLALVWRAR